MLRYCGSNEPNNLRSCQDPGITAAGISSLVVCVAGLLEREGLWVFGSGSLQETRFYISPHSSGYCAASLIRPLQGWRRQADQPIKRVMPQPEA